MKIKKQFDIFGNKLTCFLEVGRDEMIETSNSSIN